MADCPLTFASPNAPSKHVLGNACCLCCRANRYAHITVARCDAVNPRLLGMTKVVSEDVRRGLAKRRGGRSGVAAGASRLLFRAAAERTVVLDIDSTIKPLYGHQEGAMVGLQPAQARASSHQHYTFMMAKPRLVLGVDVQPGDEHTLKHGQAGLWSLLHRLERSRCALLAGAAAR